MNCCGHLFSRTTKQKRHAAGARRRRRRTREGKAAPTPGRARRAAPGGRPRQTRRATDTGDCAPPFSLHLSLRLPEHLRPFTTATSERSRPMWITPARRRGGCKVCVQLASNDGLHPPRRCAMLFRPAAESSVGAANSRRKVGVCFLWALPKLRLSSTRFVESGRPEIAKQALVSQ